MTEQNKEILLKQFKTKINNILNSHIEDNSFIVNEIEEAEKIIELLNSDFKLVQNPIE